MHVLICRVTVKNSKRMWSSNRKEDNKNVKSIKRKQKLIIET